MPKTILLELNEVNFEAVEKYAASGELPNFAELINKHGICETTSEKSYEELEPWIQWVSAHTGLTLSEHGIFRLGDIVNHDIPQIWEHLESKGLSVGAISPMNAKNRTKNAAYFVPDPWTPADLTAKPILKRLYDAVAQAVNDNADARITVKSLINLLVGAAVYARPKNYGRYLGFAARAKSKIWSKALFLDLLLTDVFIKETRRTKPDFCSLFLNAGAHIQHHYMFSSPAYSGPFKNPPWYLADGVDPVLEVYKLYDEIIAQIRAHFPAARLMLATGLHQDPHDSVTYYWRLKNHAEFLNKIGIKYKSVEPRMSRDFVVFCADNDEAAKAENVLKSAVSEDGAPLFEVDNRGQDLFVMLTWPHDISDDFSYRIGNQQYTGFKSDVAFVAIKNGQHNGIGYFLDTGEFQADGTKRSFPITQIPEHICKSFDLQWEN